jgi:hypothetical protein
MRERQENTATAPSPCARRHRFGHVLGLFRSVLPFTVCPMLTGTLAGTIACCAHSLPANAATESSAADSINRRGELRLPTSTARASHHSDSTGERITASDPAAVDRWGTVPTKASSVANFAPLLLPYFNNGPVFGLPGTELGNFWHRTQLSGDWGGIRTMLARHGYFVDLYSTGAYQDVASGGLKAGGSFIQNNKPGYGSRQVLDPMADRRTAPDTRTSG